MAGTSAFAGCMRLVASASIATIAAWFACAHAVAQEAYPSRPVRIVVGYAAGAFNDIMVRTLLPKLTDRLGQPVVVENKPGAGGNIAAEVVAHATPDGYTLLAAPTSTFAINPAVYTKLAFDPEKDFAAVSQIANFVVFVTARGDIPVQSVAELIAWAKTNPTMANYGSVAPAFDLIAAMFNQRAGTKFERIPFKSTAETMTAIVTGQVTFAFQDYNSMAAHLKAGKARPLVTLGSSRSGDLPDTPTWAEIGLAGLEFDSLTGVVAPKATPAAIVKRLEAAFMAVMKEPEIIARWKVLGMIPIGSTAAEYAAKLTSETKRWSELAKATGIKFD